MIFSPQTQLWSVPDSPEDLLQQISLQLGSIQQAVEAAWGGKGATDPLKIKEGGGYPLKIQQPLTTVYTFTVAG